MQISPFKIERYFAKYEFNVDYVLCGSDCESMSIDELLSCEPDAADRFHQLWLGYTESLGSPDLRREISKIYRHMAPEQVLVHTGAEEAIFLFMHAMLKAGDHVIVHWPCYQSLMEVARSIGCEVSLWRADEEKRWALDPDDLKQLIKPHTRVIVVNTPHNPTGFLMPGPTFQEISHIANESGIILFSDEVYRESEYRAEDRLPAACELGEHSVSLGVMSKTYGLPGLRIGWIATQNEAVYNGMAALKDYTTICNSAPSEILAIIALLVCCSIGLVASQLNRGDRAVVPAEPAVYMWIDTYEDCPTVPDYGQLVVNRANTWTADGEPLFQYIPHGTRIQVLELSSDRFDFSKIKHNGRTTYVQTFMLDEQDPSVSGANSRPDDCLFQ